MELTARVPSPLVNLVAAISGTILCGATLEASAQNLLVADQSSGNIYEFAPDGQRTTFATGLINPDSLAFDAQGNLFVSNLGKPPTNGAGYITKITPDGIQTTVESGLWSPEGLAFNRDGVLFYSHAGSNTIEALTPEGVPTVFASGFHNPTFLAFDPAGNLFVCNLVNNTIAKVDTNGMQTVYASGLSFPEGLAFRGASNLFVANFNNGVGVTEVHPDGTQSSYPAGSLYRLTGLAFDPLGNLYVSYCIYPGGCIFKISTNGVQTVFASGLGDPEGLAFRPPGNLLAVGANIQSNHFGFTVVGTNNQVAIIEACSELTSGVWQPIQTNILTGLLNLGSWNFADPDSASLSSRYYQVTSP